MGNQRGTLMELAALSLQGLMERPLGRAITGARLAFAYAAPSYSDLVQQALDNHRQYIMSETLSVELRAADQEDGYTAEKSLEDQSWKIALAKHVEAVK